MKPMKKKFLWVIGIVAGLVVLVAIIDAIPYSPAQAEIGLRPLASMAGWIVPFAVAGLAIDRYLRNRKTK
jgi:hypothetical protein